ncbi:PepSY-associated TM helix domain-containing protein [Heyndrickxia sp. NPDC080065]|uniref:PepSY-associated TM helix domain-containing protein n=1 Tax=Heyndrickxia sp. NPDC080065 TaxID=3390568 RepID=UPI003D05791E
MKKIRQFHFWIGVILSIFLLIESVSGIYLYFQEQGRGERQFPSPPQSGFINQQGSSSNGSNTESSGTEQNGMPAFPNGQADGFDRANMMKGQNSFGMTLRSLHSGVVGLIAGIGMLLLTASGLILSFIIARANRKRRKKSTEI